MKKSGKLLLLGTALTAMMTVSASAANFTHCADALHQMDLFSGTQNGYELDRAPTRAEAAVMLVRLLGGEKDATANNYATPFTDVPTWAAPYVGWLYHNNLTAGATATTYNTQGACTAQMYATFLLRSLGYADSGNRVDFSYSNALDFAEQKGVVDALNCDSSNFLRDNVVAMSYTALATQPKDGKNATLLDQLLADGVVDATKAASTKATFDAYKQYAAFNTANGQMTDVEMNTKSTTNMTISGTQSIKSEVSAILKMNADLTNMDKTKLSMVGKTTMTTTADGKTSTETMDTESYYTNGTYYVKNGDVKYKMPMSFEDIAASLGYADVTTSEDGPITMFKSVAKNSSGSYVLEMAPSVIDNVTNEIAGDIAGTDLSGLADMMNCKNMTLTVVPQVGKLKSMTLDTAYNVNMEGMNMSMTMNVSYDIVATGTSVRVTLPSDLGTYTEMTTGEE